MGLGTWRPSTVRPTSRRFLAVVAASAIAVTGCASAAPSRVEVFITRDFRIVAEPARISSGETIIKVQNDDDGRHRVILAKTDLKPAELPVRDGIVPDGGASESEFQADGYFVQVKLDTMKAYFIGPQKVVETIHDYVAPGRYVLLCNLPGHYERGEFVEIIVEDRR